MELHILGSGSSGNGYVLRAKNGEALVLECGVPLSIVKKSIGYMVSDVVGIFVTHEHGDHAGRCQEYLDNLAAKMYMSEGTWNAIADRCRSRRPPCAASHMCAIRCGGFRVTPLLLKSANGNLTHDAAEPMCFVVDHEEMGRLLFATDTYCIPYRVKGLNQVMIECNYDLDILEERFENGLVDPKRRMRTIESHMSLENCKHELAEMDLAYVMNVVLVHMSKDNGNLERFTAEVARSIKKRVIVAQNGQKLKLSKEPF